MKKLCFGTLATVLVRCSAPTTTQKQLVGTMLLSVNKIYDIRTDDGTTSALALGRVNLSDEVTVYARAAEPTAVAASFKSNVLRSVPVYSNLHFQQQAGESCSGDYRYLCKKLRFTEKRDFLCIFLWHWEYGAADGSCIRFRNHKSHC